MENVMPELPQKLFMRYDDEELSKDNDEQFLLRAENPEDISIENKVVIAGVYELTKKVRIINRTEVFDIDEE
jgi:hypothetical protein